MGAVLAYAPVICLVILAAPFLLAPVVVRFSSKYPARPEYKSIDPTPPDFPYESSLYFDDIVNRMSGEGFDLVGYYFQENPDLGLKNYLAMFKSNCNHDRALAIMVFRQKGNALKNSNKCLEFSTRFTDGAEVNTANSTAPAIFKIAPHRTSVQLEGVDSPKLLYEIHRSMVEDHDGETMEPPGEDDPAVFLEKVSTKVMNEQVDAGYYYIDEAAGVYRPTLKGAFIMTWKLMWPFKSIIRSRKNARTKAMFGEFFPGS